MPRAEGEVSPNVGRVELTYVDTEDHLTHRLPVRPAARVLQTSQTAITMLDSRLGMAKSGAKAASGSNASGSDSASLDIGERDESSSLPTVSRGRVGSAERSRSSAGLQTDRAGSALIRHAGQGGGRVSLHAHQAIRTASRDVRGVVRRSPLREERKRWAASR